MSLAAAASVYALAVGTAAGREWDAEHVAMALDGGERRTATAVALVVNPATAALAIAAVALLARRRGGRPAALAVAVIAGGAGLVAVALEHALGVLDPTGGEHERALGASFFPSGHATVATAVLLALLLATRGSGRRVPPAATGVAAAMLAAPHFLIGWHHPTDVVGGVLVATCWTAAVAWALGRVAAYLTGPEASRNHSRGGLLPAVAAVMLAAAAVLGVALPVPLPAGLAAAAVLAAAAWAAVAFSAAVDASPRGPREGRPSHASGAATAPR